MDRDTLQGTAAHLLAKEQRLLCQWATSVGKSKVALKFLQDNPGMDCLILVPEQNNIQNWIDEFNKFKVPTDKVTVSCYASFHKYENTRWDLLVFDEVPHIDTDLRKKVCKSVKGQYILALGAVVDDEELESLESSYGKFYKSVVTLKNAIEWGIVPAPRIYIVHLELDNTVKSFYINGIKCTAEEKYRSIVAKVNNAKAAFDKNPSAANKRIMYTAGNERKRFLGKLKLDTVRYMSTNLAARNQRFLCFCASIKQAQELGGPNAYTSKTPKSKRVLDKFNNHEIDSLFVVSKLIEGQNLTDIESGIITQLGGTPRITVQMIGRILRSKEPIVYIPVFDNTKDDSFLWTVTSSIPENCIKHCKLKTTY